MLLSNLLGRTYTGRPGPVVTGAEFVGNDIQFTDELANTFLLENAKITLKGDQLANIPPSGNTTVVAADAGKYLSATGTVTINASTGFANGDAVSIFNNSASPITIVATGVTLRLTASSLTGNRALAAFGLATILCVGTNSYVIVGSGVT